MITNFPFLKTDWPEVFEAAARAESYIHSDPRSACFYARRALDLAVRWAYKYDSSLRYPYQDNLNSLIHEPTFKAAAGEAVFAKARWIVQMGNRAVHETPAIPRDVAVAVVRDLFHFAYWFAHSYAADPPSPSLQFDPALIPAAPPSPAQSSAQLRALEDQLRERDEKLSEILRAKDGLDEELKRLRAEIAEARKLRLLTADTHDYDEASTRDAFIDLLLREAGWLLDRPQDTEFEVRGMPNEQGVGYVDYVLWGDDGRPLGLVEAKRTRIDPRIGQQQAKLYADCLEAQFGVRPVIFYTNGYDHWMWDDRRYPPRRVQGFYKKDEVELLLQRRITRKPLAQGKIDEAIADRYYQTRCIRRIAESFEKDNERKTLAVMATGAGKTRTIVALSDLLMRCNWAKRVLFLCDRVALVRQAVNAFKKHLPESSPVNLVTEKDKQGRVYVSTYPTMMTMIDEMKGGVRRFGPGHFDLVVIDEAHRSIFDKYAAIFDYFDSLLVGLTATPRDEIDRNTYRIFDLENGVPTDAYSLEEAVADRYLVPFEAVSVPLRFQREGIKYDELPEDEKEQWDNLEWEEEGGPPEAVNAEALNKWLFNKDTVDKVLAHLMTHGQKVAGGDRLGKTIIFAARQQHADFIAERFDKNYPSYTGFARVVYNGIDYVQTLIDDFSVKEKNPHIAISVDMLDTGIDVPEVVNLVFFKLVRSKTKFWQMVGRGTRLCPDLFGPGDDKKKFFIFDFCQNLEYFRQDPPTTEGAVGGSLSSKIFDARLRLIEALDKELPKDCPGESVREFHSPYDEAGSEESLRADIAAQLQQEVASMRLDNFVVRPHRRLVERYREPEAWSSLSHEDIVELADRLAGLPGDLEREPEEAKRFDLLLLRLQLALLTEVGPFRQLQDTVRTIAGLLQEKSTIPMVQAQMELILDVQTDEWWQDVTLPMLERVRRRLRGLVQFIERRQRKPIYTDFEDTMGEATTVVLREFGTAASFESFREKARHFLRNHETHPSVRKLRMNEPLTQLDLDELEVLLETAKVGGHDEIETAKKEAKGLGIFVRSLVGLDRQAAKAALSTFMEMKTLTSDQIEFVDMIINHLAEHGIMEKGELYDSPFTDIAPRGPEGMFTVAQLDELLAALDSVNRMPVGVA